MYAVNQNNGGGGGYGRKNLPPIAKNNQYNNVFVLPTKSAQATPLPPIKAQNSYFSSKKKIFLISLIVLVVLAIVSVVVLLAYFLTHSCKLNFGIFYQFFIFVERQESPSDSFSLK